MVIAAASTEPKVSQGPLRGSPGLEHRSPVAVAVTNVQVVAPSDLRHKRGNFLPCKCTIVNPEVVEIGVRIIKHRRAANSEAIPVCDVCGADIIIADVKSAIAEARLDIFQFIEGWYNPHRRYKGIGQKSPINFEKLHHLQHDLSLELSTRPG